MLTGDFTFHCRTIRFSMCRMLSIIYTNSNPNLIMKKKIYGLGSDSDLIQNAPNSYTTSFEGKWVALNDTFLNCTVIDMKDGVITFFFSGAAE